jgi:hemoglobin
MTALPPRFDITEGDIDRVVDRFYARVREHRLLGPVFAAHVGDWPAHEETVARFWRNSILHMRVYEGSPMAAHLRAGDVRPGMFGPWLALFDEVLQAELTPQQAEAWSALAHRIGRSLRAGTVERERLPGGIPKLT